MNKQRSEEKIIKEMKDVFGENSIMVYGDWSAKDQMKNYISTPNVGLKRRIGKRKPSNEIKPEKVQMGISLKKNTKI